MSKVFTSLLVLLFGVACQERAAHDPTGYENPVGKAVILQLIQESKAVYGEQPMALAIGGAMRSASPDFLKSLADEGHTFLKMDALDYDRVTKATVVRGSRENPIVIQLSKIAEPEAGDYKVEAAWNRNRDLVRKVYRVSGDPDAGNLTVTELEVLEDNRFPEEAKAE